AKADLEILKFEDTPDPVAPGGTITYHLEVKNLGPNPACNVTLQQSVPGGELISSNDSCGPVGASAIACSIAPELPTGPTVSLETKFQAPDTCPIPSMAKVSSDTSDP